MFVYCSQVLVCCSFVYIYLCIYISFRRDVGSVLERIRPRLTCMSFPLSTNLPQVVCRLHETKERSQEVPKICSLYRRGKISILHAVKPHLYPPRVSALLKATLKSTPKNKSQYDLAFRYLHIRILKKWYNIFFICLIMFVWGKNSTIFNIPHLDQLMTLI